MKDGTRWVVAVVAAIAIVALVAFARGGAERGNPTASPSAIISGWVA